MKTIILGPKNADKIGLAKEIANLNDNMRICLKFNTNQMLKDKMSEDYEYFLDNASTELETGFKNEAFLYVISDEDKSYGVTLCDWYNCDIAAIDFDAFNSISEKTFKSELSKGILYVVLDSNEKHNHTDINESFSTFNRINGERCLYFMHESLSSAAVTVLKMLDAYNRNDMTTVDNIFYEFQ